MCGICGIWDPFGEHSVEERSELLGQALDCLRHRGPDHGGVWREGDDEPFLGHRRLAILDLSPQGNQPMVSSSGRFVLSYNGEIYNFRELCQQLRTRGASLAGDSDTQVLLACFEEWGVQPTLLKAQGMFAFALWDRQLKVLSLARDRLGKKPLFYRVDRDSMWFASELSASKCMPGFPFAVDREALNCFLTMGYCPQQRSLFSGIQKAVPGELIQFRWDGQSIQSHREAYWVVIEAARRARATRFSGSYEEAGQHLEGLLRECTRLRMESDVSLGALLSGGIDSSLVVALMQAQSSQAIRTFSIGFGEEAYNEAPHAAAIARHLGTEHCELYVTEREGQEVILQLMDYFDEPIGDSSQIPTYLVSQLARQKVTVALSGDGGDELFGGYHRYKTAARVWPWTQSLGLLLRMVPSAAEWFGSRVIRREVWPSAWRRRLDTFWSLLQASDPVIFYQSLTAHSRQSLLKDFQDLDFSGWYGRLPAEFQDIREQMMLCDTRAYLVEDILVKVDRASMSNSLEIRCPLLDHQVLEFAWSLPLDWKISQGQGKRILRDILARFCPRGLFERPKKGFCAPVVHWLRGPLRSWASELLSVNELRKFDLLQPERVTRVWNEFLNGHTEHEHLVWSLLSLQLWLGKWTRL